MQKIVPSPEEIKLRLKMKEQENARTPNLGDVRELVEEKVGRVTKEVRDILAQSRAERFSPAKMREAILLIFKDENFHPIEELISLYKDEKVTLDQKIRIAVELASYIAPKLKSVEVSGQVDHAHTVVIERYGDDGKVTREPMKMPASSPLPALTKPVITAVDAEVVK